MMLTTQVVVLLVILSMSRFSLSCEESDKPLLLSPYLDNDQVQKARLLSKVDPDCLEDFVPESHTGFLTVDKKLKNHLFFWFFPSSKNGHNAPLLFWLNGGPGMSSLFGLLWAHGPMEVRRKQAKEDKRDNCHESHKESKSGYTKRKYPWTDDFSVVYVDNPVGVGFSFSESSKEGFRTTEEGYTKDLVSFVNQFLKLFPEYKATGVYLGGQSYAGRYITSLAYGIHMQMQENRSRDNYLTGIYLGAPLLDHKSQIEVFYKFIYNLGIISHKTLTDLTEGARLFYKRAKSQNLTTEESMIFHQKGYRMVKTQNSLHNFVTGERANYEQIANLMLRPDMKRAAHAGDRDFYIFNGQVHLSLWDDWHFGSTKNKLPELLNHYKVLIYNGNFDLIINTPMIETVLLNISWNFQEEYANSTRLSWNRGNNAIGYYSLTDKFCRVVIHGSGHQVPHEKPEIAHRMISQFINDGCVHDFNASTPTTLGSSSSVSMTPHFTTMLISAIILAIVQNCYAM